MNRYPVNKAIRRVQRGVTLVELMVTLAVAIVLMSVGVPMYQSLVANNRAVSQSNALVLALQLARSEAVSRLGNVAVCARATDSSCGTSSDWAAGWLVFVDSNTNGSYQSASEELIRVFGALPAGASVVPQGSAAFVRFGANGMASGAEDFELDVDEARGAEARCIHLNLQGQIRLEKDEC